MTSKLGFQLGIGNRWVLVNCNIVNRQPLCWHAGSKHAHALAFKQWLDWIAHALANLHNGPFVLGCGPRYWSNCVTLPITVVIIGLLVGLRLLLLLGAIIVSSWCASCIYLHTPLCEDNGHANLPTAEFSIQRPCKLAQRILCVRLICSSIPCVM